MSFKTFISACILLKSDADVYTIVDDDTSKNLIEHC